MVSETDTPALQQDEPGLMSWPFALVMLSGFVYFTAVGAMIPATPQFVEQELGGGGIEVGIGVGSFAVSAVVLRPWIGRLGDRHGRRVLVVVGAAIAGTSILLYPLATALPVFVALRLCTGAGEAAFFTAVVTLSQDLAPGHRRGEAASYFSVALYGGLGAGPPLAERLLDARGFSPVFVAFGLCCLGAAALGTRVPRGIPASASDASPTTLAVADAAPNALPCGPPAPIGSGAPPDPAPGAPPDPIPADGIPADRGPATAPPQPGPRKRALIHVPAVWPGIVLALGLIPLTAFASFLPLYADEIEFEHVGTVLALYSALIVVVRIAGARLPDALGWWRASAIALCGAAGGIVLLGLWGSAVAVWVGTITMALGMSLLFPALLSALVGTTPESERSFAVATFMAFFDLSLGLGAAMVGGVVSLSSQRAGFVFAGFCGLGGLVAQVLLRDRIGSEPQPA